MTFNVVDHLCEKKTPDFLETKLIWEGRVGVGIAVGARVIGSEVVFWGIFRNVPSHNTGTTPGPHQIPRYKIQTYGKGVSNIISNLRSRRVLC